MDKLVSNAPIRAATFFTLAVVLMAIGGLLIGDLVIGIRWGLALGVAIGVFAYFFIKPTEGECESPEAEADPDKPSVDE